MKRNWAGWLFLAVSCVAVGWFFEVDYLWRFDRAVAQRVLVSELGTPRWECEDNQHCFGGWRCDDGDRLLASRAPDERIFAFHRIGWTVVFVLVSPDGHVKSFARCGS